MKLTKKEYLDLDELKLSKGWKVIKKVLNNRKNIIYKSISGIQSDEARDKINHIKGRILEMDNINKLVENAYENSKKGD